MSLLRSNRLGGVMKLSLGDRSLRFIAEATLLSLGLIIDSLCMCALRKVIILLLCLFADSRLVLLRVNILPTSGVLGILCRPIGELIVLFVRTLLGERSVFWPVCACRG